MARERRRLSLVRVAVVLGVVAATGWGVAAAAVGTWRKATLPAPAMWFAPYVDASLTPALPFEDPTSNPSPQVVLGFVVADRADRCAPSWGTYYSLDTAAATLDLDRRIVRLRQRQGEVVVSFGGALNDELAVACTDPARLAAAYRAVVDRYRLRTIDLDLEGPGLADPDARSRRAAAIAALQAGRTGEDRVAVWLTLPVDTGGLTPDGVAVVTAMLDAGVEVAGVNAMTMDFGGSKPADMSMTDALTAALDGTARQVDAAYRSRGIALDAAALGRRLGATPMIGQNDVPGEVFTLDDARALFALAQRRQLGRLSMWSASRDGPCGAQLAGAPVSNTCSGVAQEPFDFAHVFLAARTVVPGPASTTTATTAVAARDDPATSPYPIWRPTKAYTQGQKTVWQHNVYEAKWFTRGDRPDAPVDKPWNTPWRYVGPVLAGDGPALATTLPPGTYPDWSPTADYRAGERVLFGGLAYRAKWFTRGEPPQPDPDDPNAVPWERYQPDG